MGKIDMGIFYGKLYNSHNRTFSIINGEKFIDETGPGFLLCSWLLKTDHTTGSNCVSRASNRSTTKMWTFLALSLSQLIMMKDVPIQMSSFSFVYTLKTSIAWQSVVVTIF